MVVTRSIAVALLLLDLGCERATAPSPASPADSRDATAAVADDPTAGRSRRLQGITVGREHACAWTREGAAVCWGGNRFGQLGHREKGSRTGQCRPLEVPDLVGVSAMAAAGRYACAIEDRGSVTCFGEHPSRQADSAIGDRVTHPIATGAVEIAAASDYACARAHDGQVWCWGRELSAGPDTGSLRRVPNISGATAIAVGPAMACATLDAGPMKCWGAIASLLRAPPAGVYHFDPQPLAGLANARAPVISESIPCAIDGEGYPWCWATGGSGRVQLSAEPHRLGAGGAQSLFGSSNGRFGCALVSRRGVARPRCWNLAEEPASGAEAAEATLKIPSLPMGVGLHTLALGPGLDSRPEALRGCLLREDDGVTCWLANGEERWRDELAALARGAWATDLGAACQGVDRDGDGQPDATDRCPGQPEVYNGRDDGDGCPDEPPSLVRIDPRGHRIELLSTVVFEFNKERIRPESFEMLEHLAAAIIGNPQLARIEIQGHKDSKGGEAYGRRPTQRRAQSVREFLVEHGVAQERVVAKGYGEDKPIASNKTAEGRALNRRIELVIVEWAD